LITADWRGEEANLAYLVIPSSNLTKSKPR